jgi:hypothetical protein
MAIIASKIQQIEAAQRVVASAASEIDETGTVRLDP